MGAGLQRAVAAAIETQLGEGEASRIRDFVRDVDSFTMGAPPKKLKRPADRTEDRIRQKARRLGLVQYTDARWLTTPLGKTWLDLNPIA